MLSQWGSVEELKKCIEVIWALRHPKTGCPWDLKQTHSSLLRFLLEETYEFMTAVENQNFQEMEDELGDILLQVLLHSALAEQSGNFTLESVSKNLREKLVRRHPHVFGEAPEQLSTDEVINRWDKIKRTEKDNKKVTFKPDILNLPALLSSYKIGRKTEKFGFDWKSSEEVFKKLDEERHELEAEIKASNQKGIEEEFGDFLFTAAQVGRHLGLNPEECLRLANKKFLRRFSSLDEKLLTKGKTPYDVNSDTLEELWNEVKRDEKK